MKRPVTATVVLPGPTLADGIRMLAAAVLLAEAEREAVVS